MQALDYPVVVGNLAGGGTTDRILRSYSTLQLGGIQATLLYAADLACGRIVTLPTGAE